MTTINHGSNGQLDANTILNENMNQINILKRNGLIPVLQDNDLLVYRVTGKPRLHILSNGYRRDMSDTYGTVKRDSKIASAVDLIERDGIVDLDLLASMTVELLYETDLDHSVINSHIEEVERIYQMPFTNSEKELSEGVKRAIIRTIIAWLDIECIYCDDVDNIPAYVMESMFGNMSKESVIAYARHNADILYNSKFNDVYYGLYSSKEKVLKKESE